MRIVLIILSILVLSISTYASIYYFHRATSWHYELDGERYTRMVTEETLLKANRKIDILESEISKLQKSLLMKEKLVQQSEAINADMKLRLERDAQIKVKMENKLRELMALTSDQPLVVPAGNMQ